MRRSALALLLTFALTSSFALQADKPKKEDTKPAAKAEKKEEKKDEKKEPEKPKDPMSSGTFSGLRFRSIGPAFVSGRISWIAVNPKNRAEYYVAAASGGVWKTTNSGTTFSPVFENEGAYSIGYVAIDPKDPSVVWVGTGENNGQRAIGYGDGVYRSEDGGKSWKNMGLKKSEHIARILIDPRDSNVVYVAAQGPLWSAGGDRGLYKTTDGGKNWKAVLTISENTGVSDVVMDPSNPDVLYASAWQRRRHVWTLISGGPEGAIYKSTDAGATWNKINSGLPSVELGRIGLAISSANPNILYAVVEAAERKGGIFRSRDRGATWEKRNDFQNGAMYYGTIFADPKNADRIYIMDTLNRVSDDGGKTVRPLGEKSKHVDNHVLWVDPNDTNYYLNGCDGGVYESFDRGETWRWKENLPIGQFYDVTADNSKPFYYVYGGTQDNNSLGGPSRTRSASGIINTDWFITNGGDGFRTQVDPEDPNILYAESQYGGLVRFDRRTGENFGIQPQEGKGEPGLHWNWDSPLIISPHLHTRLYFAANKLFRSDDRGNTWKAVSPDLTRQLDRDKLPVMGKIQGPDAVSKHQSTSIYGNIVALSESPKQEGVLYVGTDDGLVQVSEDSGQTWRKIESFTGVPDRTYVSRLAASQHEARTVYATFNNHKMGDYKPYVLKSADAGSTWTSIASNLPENGAVWGIAEDPVNPSLLFVGTEFGMYFTIDGGGKWVQLKGGLPTIPVRDIVVQKREGDLVIATFGRSFYVLDDYTPLRRLKAEDLQSEASLQPMNDTMMYVESLPLGGRGKSSFGESFFIADNPAYGSTFTYYLKEKYKTPKEKRQDAEKKAGADPYATLPYPNNEQLRAEADYEAPSLWVTVTDEQGSVVRRIQAKNEAGYQRVSWDLRYPPVELAERSGDEVFPWEFGPVGPLVMPGKYSAKLSKKVDGKFTDLSGPVSFNVYVEGQDKMKAEDVTVLHNFQRKLAELDRAVGGALGLGNDLSSKIGRMRRALAQTPADTSALVLRVDQVEANLRPIMIALRGDSFLRQRQEPVPPSINDRVNNIAGDQRFATSRPSQTHLDAYAIAADEFEGALNRLKALLQETTQIEAEMEKMGAPWTPGRVPEWHK
ncbi:MAG: glycosyl hydrolase [Acidobacteriales bacterium]|nr:glycosyl hydrolase [Terriglobales bacterium]